MLSAIYSFVHNQSTGRDRYHNHAEKIIVLLFKQSGDDFLCLKCHPEICTCLWEMHAFSCMFIFIFLFIK